ncbi:ATP-binding cassette sub-family G member 8 isoform X1 [Diorhabda sublineata]|uniref:ATP-binding cassette sub-family G member 8 isoform X1 n=2 Tax=Diorhabda sublineata TaxID=1163346 RepID=UPI0024E08E66|nr:ATP-binding cassette sub-family G member 8 isoform X1 [Diorhabda sublineata]XP_056632615.1 ATP-binding cassette sub-family G member 8 isoform X1 [Diorhabda sublineata]
MVRSRTPSQGGGSQGFEMERKYSVPSNPESRTFSGGTTSEDLHAWSIYRQNLNSDFTDSALGSTDKSPLPYGNFQLRDTTVQSILSHPRYGPKSALGSNMYTYLKFGLPRVFPPNHIESNRSGTPQHFRRNSSTRPPNRSLKAGSRGPRDGSSGYDSSDNETTNNYKYSRKYRSDPDFRMQNMYQRASPGLPLAAMHQGGIKQHNTQWNRNKSISEANLLASEYQRSYHTIDPSRDLRRNSVADFVHNHDMVDHGIMPHIGRPTSKTESHFSLPASRRGPPSVLRTDYLSQDDASETTFMYPHLQVHGLGVLPSSTSCKSRHHLLLNEISFEIRGGEIMAIISTSEEEGTALLDVVAGLQKPVLGTIILNGRKVESHTLKPRVAYVQSDLNLCKDMTVVQTLRFHYDLRKPTDKLGYLKIEAMDRINVIIEDLGLEQVRDTKVSSMTISERRRLNVACHLILDTDIVVLDQPTKGMDIFDTFFLVEYLKQWANGGAGSSLGRIVVLTIHPPTYEIFTMLSRILLVSSGRTMYSGKRKHMLPYFALVEYPCPSFKNPSDYYLDLVTLDDLSAEAMLESSQRIEQLAEIFRQKQQPLSDPGPPPSSLPMCMRHSNCCAAAFILFTKSIIYTQSATFLNWLTVIILSASLSLILGTIFWDIPSSDSQLILNDRQGYHYSVMCLVNWPLLLALTIVELRRNRKVVERDINDGLYGRITYIVTKSIINLFPSLFVWLIYVVPSYSMSGLYMQDSNSYDGFYIYIGLMLLYLSCIQMVLTAFIYLVPLNNVATILCGVFLSALFIIAGYVLHLRDLPIYTQWIQNISPAGWLIPYLLNRELSQEAILSLQSTISTVCRNKQIQHQDIIVQLPCPPPNGTNILKTFGFLKTDNLTFDYGDPAIAMGVFYCILFIVACFSFTIQYGRRKNYQQKGKNNANTP